MTTRKTAAKKKPPSRFKRARKKGLPPWLTAVSGDRTYEWAIKAWDRAAKVPGAWFDEAKADAIVARWPTIFRLTDDRFAGVPFVLNDWQEIIVRLLFGWKAPEEIKDPLTGEKTFVHVRIFRRLRLWVPRKNGKSEFLAALGLAFAALDPVTGGQGYVFARDEDQAELPFARMKAMVALSPGLASDCQTTSKGIYIKPAATGIQLLTGSETGKHGKSPTMILGDEMHEWKSREIENTLRQGTGARLEPIELYASTAGLKTNPTGVELWEESKEILDGTRSDPGTLVAIFAADEDWDWEDESVWEAANPSLGLSPTIGFLRREAALAKDNPRAEAKFKCYHLNIWAEAETRWLNMRHWDKCSQSKTGWKTAAEKYRGRRCFGAFDLSNEIDITALCWLFPPTDDDPMWRTAYRFWLPEDKLAERVKIDRMPYDKFFDQGALELTEGDFVDQDAVLNAVLEGMEAYDIQRLGYDNWQANKLVGDLQKQGVDPEFFMVVRMGVRTLGEPSAEFERLVYAHKFDHGGHPVLRWMARNAIVRFDENMNFMPAKKKSAEKIDGIVASVMALGVAMSGEEDDNGGVAAWLNSMKRQAAADAE